MIARYEPDASKVIKTRLYCLVSLALIERAGRRVLLAVSSVWVSASMAGLALHLQLAVSLASPGLLASLPLLLVILAFIGFSVGLATIPLSLIGELLPAR